MEDERQSNVTKESLEQPQEPPSEEIPTDAGDTSGEEIQTPEVDASISEAEGAEPQKDELPVDAPLDDISEKPGEVIEADVLVREGLIPEEVFDHRPSLPSQVIEEITKKETEDVSTMPITSPVDNEINYFDMNRDTDGIKITGDFVQSQKSSVNIDEASILKTPSYQSVEAEPVVEEEIVLRGEIRPEEESVEPEESIDRQIYYDKYSKLVLEHGMARRKNNFLMRKMADYYKKRRMDHVLKEGDNYEENLRKYHMKLDAFGELKDLEERERRSITNELNQMSEQRNLEKKLLSQEFEAMQARERSIGIGLTYVKTGKQIPDKMVERYLRNQRQKTIELASLRVAYIKMRDRIQEKQTALDDLDKIGDNFHLIDYEQLKIENRNHADKIEERDEELSKLREKCIAAIDCLAHIREKSAEIQLEIQEHNEQLEEAQMETWECRERVNYFKLERDNIRVELEKLKEDSGLLTKSKLLSDMEVSMKEREEVKNELQQIIETYGFKKVLIGKLKALIDGLGLKAAFFGPISRPIDVKKAQAKLEAKRERARRDPIEYSHITIH